MSARPLWRQKALIGPMLLAIRIATLLVLPTNQALSATLRPWILSRQQRAWGMLPLLSQLPAPPLARQASVAPPFMRIAVVPATSGTVGSPAVLRRSEQAIGVSVHAHPLSPPHPPPHPLRRHLPPPPRPCPRRRPRRRRPPPCPLKLRLPCPPLLPRRPPPPLLLRHPLWLPPPSPLCPPLLPHRHLRAKCPA